jgi:hypothetical protein
MCAHNFDGDETSAIEHGSLDDLPVRYLVLSVAVILLRGIDPRSIAASDERLTAGDGDRGA